MSSLLANMIKSYKNYTKVFWRSKKPFEKERLDGELNSGWKYRLKTKEKFLLPDYEREELITEKCRAYPEI